MDNPEENHVVAHRTHPAPDQEDGKADAESTGQGRQARARDWHWGLAITSLVVAAAIW